MRIDELMTRDVVSIPPETPVKDVASLLVEHRIAGVPVCDASGRVLGVVSESDLLWKELGVSEHRRGLIDWILNGSDNWRHGCRSTGCPSSMAKRLVGIVSRADLVCAFQRWDDAIARHRSTAELVEVHVGRVSAASTSPMRSSKRAAASPAATVSRATTVSASAQTTP